MDTFKLCALQDGYNFVAGNNVRQQYLEGGMPRKVIKFVGAVHRVGVQVTCQDEFARQYFWAFYYQNQTREFIWTLSLDNGDLEECVCTFDCEETPVETLIGIHARRMSFTVFVRPKPRDENLDRDVITLFDGTEGNASFEIEKIPNVYFPDATGVE